MAIFESERRGVGEKLDRGLPKESRAQFTGNIKLEGRMGASVQLEQEFP